MHHGRLTTRMKIGLAAATLTLTAAALAGSMIGAAGAARANAEAGATVKTRTTALGRILVDARGHSLYLFEKDKGGHSACYGQCAKFWPPLLTSDKPVAGAGATASLLGMTTRTGGTHQVTYGGHPLYRFALDKQPGQTKGEGSKAFGAEWYVVSPAGKKIDKD
jgi:predicted lipoprotein with Yx(FWY)xxD motif